MTIGTRMQQRRATAATWAISPFVLAAGELGVATDTKIIKIGDGANVWADLPVAFENYYLGKNAKAADTDLFDGMNSTSFLLVSDADTAATADKIAKRNSSGRLKAATGASADDVVNYAQMVAADTATGSAAVTTAKQMVNSRTVTADFTLQASDAGCVVFVNGSSYSTTILCTVPTNASVPIPIGTIIELRTAFAGLSPMSLNAAAGVSIAGSFVIHGQASSMRLMKNGTDSWVVLSIDQSPGPALYRRAKYGSDNTLALGAFTKVRWDGADDGTATKTNNYDTLGANAQYNSSSDLYKCFIRRSGYYDLDIQVAIEQNASGRFYFQLKINGVLQKLGAGGPRINGPHMVNSISACIPFNVGDYIETEVYVEGGSAPIWLADEPYANTYFNWAWRRSL